MTYCEWRVKEPSSINGVSVIANPHDAGGIIKRHTHTHLPH